MGGDLLRGLSLGMCSASLSGNMFFIKAFMKLFILSTKSEDAAEEIWTHWLPYLMFLAGISVALGSTWFIATGMREYEAIFMVSVNAGAWVVSTAVSGAVVFGDMSRMELWQIIIFWFAVAVILAGIAWVVRTSPKILGMLAARMTAPVAARRIGESER